MRLHISKLAVVAGLLGAPSLRAQFDFQVAGRPVQFHSFASQGYAYSNQNNYLTLKSSQGTFEFTEGGVNVSTRITNRLRVGAQVYVRNIGNLGQGHPVVDWAYADYQITEWLGVRGGKVKTVMGLYNDTQDAEFLHTFALLPQAVYSLDLREATIAHTGGDVYGSVRVHDWGTFSYTAYVGRRSDNLHGGYPYLLNNLATINLNSLGGLQWGGDLRWNTPVRGLLLGASHMNADVTGTGIGPVRPGNRTQYGPYRETSNKDQTSQVYGQFTIGNLRVDSEYRRYWRDQSIYNGQANSTTDARGWYGALAYRFSKRWELGSYYSRFVLKSRGSPSTKPGDYPINDRVLTLRVDLNSHWNAKVEGHFIQGDGGGAPYPSGFYRADNPQGLKPNMNMIVVRTGWNF